MKYELGRVNCVTLPLPPSANRYWRSIIKNGRATAVLSREARLYKERAELLLSGFRTECLTDPVCVDLTIWFKNKRGDLDNKIKPALDSLQGYCFANDSQVHELHIRRRIDKHNPRIEATVTTI